MSSDAPLFIGVAGNVPGAAALLMPEVAGAKAAELSRISALGLPVPPAFVLPTSLCGPVNEGDHAALAALDRGLHDGVARLEEASGRRLGDSRAPLLVSVRSGAAQSMPGMLDTILDVGLNTRSVRGLIGLTGNPRLAWDSYRRFIRGYAEVVENAPLAPFDECLLRMIKTEGVTREADLDPEALERLAAQYLAIAADAAGRPIPEDPIDQLGAAARAVYRSWESPRAQNYRRLNHLSNLGGTAVAIQAMVFGNAGGRSGAGVAFSRNPASGARELYVDFLFDAQGEDVVAGRRMAGDDKLLAARLPEAARALAQGATRLEREFRDVQDIEFTIEEGRLFFLQARPAKRSPRAALRILVDLVAEGLLDPATARERAARIDAESVRITRFAAPAPPIATAVSAAPGVASGRIAFDSARASALAGAGNPVILVRRETSTDDVAGFAVAAGILTAVGGRTAHAAVVARDLGKVCLVGCRDLSIAAGAASGEIAGHRIAEGDWISLDGESGEISLGQREIIADLPKAELAAIAAWRGREAPVSARGSAPGTS
jgi:pyruvate, orthophosphate dikinase